MKFFKSTFRKHRSTLERALRRTAQRFTPPGYDERRVLFALGQAARNATDISRLYELIVKEVAGALGATSVSLFVRDDATGDYLCRVSTKEPANLNSCELAAALPISSRMLATDALSVKRLRGLGAPLGLSSGDLETWLRAVASFDPARRAARERECETLRALDARLLLGITMQERLVGVLSLGPRQGSRGYTAEDKRMLMSVASQLAFIIENAKLAERMVAQEGLRRELALAREVQQRLLPAHPPVTPSLDLAAFCQPARAVGGDYYDFLKRDDGQLAVAVADVAGKGISAALLMSSVQASLRSQSMAQCAGGVDASPAALVRTMNRLLYAATGAANYVTFFYAQFDEGARTLTYVNAGHNPPLLVRSGGISERHKGDRAQPSFKALEQGTPQAAARSAIPLPVCASDSHAGVALEPVTKRIGAAIEPDGLCGQTEMLELTAGGPVLGVFEDCCYEQETLRLEIGDLLIAYTDGVTESLNREGDEFGEARLREALAADAHLPSCEVRDRVVRLLGEWSAGAPQHDDLTFIVLKVK